jgi:N-acetylglutamate synthase-like GNAT family acetyltransferase
VVGPELRGNGIGHQLVASICAEADHRGIPRVTVPSSSRAIPLYKRAGFENLGDLLARTQPSTSTTQ